eukprot:scaffold47312_cov30-Tisochrysis_lutea.AAC.2
MPSCRYTSMAEFVSSGLMWARCNSGIKLQCWRTHTSFDSGSISARRRASVSSRSAWVGGSHPKAVRAAATSSSAWAVEALPWHNACTRVRASKIVVQKWRYPSRVSSSPVTTLR